MDAGDQKEDKMTEFRSGMAMLQNANNSIKQRGRLTKDIPIASLLALVISLAGCIAFCVLFHYALSGFYNQLNELVPIQGFVSIQTISIAIGVIFSLMAIIYFVVGTISTKSRCQLFYVCILISKGHYYHLSPLRNCGNCNHLYWLYII